MSHYTADSVRRMIVETPTGHQDIAERLNALQLRAENAETLLRENLKDVREFTEKEFPSWQRAMKFTDPDQADGFISGQH